MMSDDFQKDVRLDKYALDQCALEQPELFAHWATLWADAVNDRDRCKDRLSLVRSECVSEIRSTPSEFGWTKHDKPPTEAFITSAICGHKNFVEANEDYLAASHEVNTLAVAKEAFDHRSKMIVVLAGLYSSSYFSGNKQMDKGYQAAMDRAASSEQNAGLEKNPRLLRRKHGIANANPNLTAD